MATDTTHPGRAWPLAAGGVALVLLGAAGYFVLVTALAGRLPWVRNTALPSWIVIAAGIALSLIAVRRAPGRWAPRLVLGVNVLLAGLFAALIYVAFLVPAGRVPEVGSPAPDFTLQDQRGETVRLSALRGTPVLLIFYRGHW